MPGKIIMLVGLPASGKSTWAKEQVNTQKGIKRVCKDDLRAMLDNSDWSKTNEKFVLAVRDGIVAQAVADGFTIIVDDTNLDEKHLRALHGIATSLDGDFEVKYFTDLPLEECIKRDAARPNSVGAKVITEMWHRYLARPATEPPTKKVVQDQTLPAAVICDIDGTVALLNGRDPYDASSCENDLLNEPVTNLVDAAIDSFGARLIFCSGREEKYREKTEAWLAKHNFGFTHLFMRKTGDKRKDNIVKREILEKEILPKYHVRAVFDDRLRVCRMWHEAGLPLFRVGDPDADF